MITDYITIEQFEDYSLMVGFTILIGLMLFIVFDLARKSKGGKWAYIALFGGLCFGVFGFAMKEVIKISLEIS